MWWLHILVPVQKQVFCYTLVQTSRLCFQQRQSRHPLHQHFKMPLYTTWMHLWCHTLSSETCGFSLPLPMASHSIKSWQVVRLCSRLQSREKRYTLHFIHLHFHYVCRISFCGASDFSKSSLFVGKYEVPKDDTNSAMLMWTITVLINIHTNAKRRPFLSMTAFSTWCHSSLISSLISTLLPLLEIVHKAYDVWTVLLQITSNRHFFASILWLWLDETFNAVCELSIWPLKFMKCGI